MDCFAPLATTLKRFFTFPRRDAPRDFAFVFHPKGYGECRAPNAPADGVTGGGVFQAARVMMSHAVAKFDVPQAI
jgi:hypothetical protein